jgi:hypothetical protein
MTICENEITEYLSINLTEDEQLWNINNKYNFEDVARWGHFLYKFAGEDGTNSSENPELEDAKTFGFWQNIAPTNYFAMLDGETKTATVSASPLILEIENSNYNVLSFFGLLGTLMTIEFFEGSETTPFLTKTLDLLDDSVVVDDLTYWFEPFTFVKKAFLGDLPLVDGKIKITLENADTQQEVQIGRIYSSNLQLNKTEFDDDLINYDKHRVRIPAEKIPYFMQKAKDLYKQPILFIADESETSNLQNLLNFGVWDSFSVPLTNPRFSTIDVTIKGLV